jgi:hypothetical protein
MLKTVSSAGSGFPITLGNTVVTAGSTTTTLGNLTLNNVIINGTTENGVQFSNVNVISGNIANVSLSNTTVTNFVKFTPSNTAPANVTGNVWYDSTIDSLAFWTSTGYEVNPGQQVDQVCYNNTGSSIPQGTAVYLSGGANGNYPYITPAIATSQNTAGVLGVTGQAIANGATGVVVALGQVFNYNTTGMTAGAQLFLSPSVAGALTTTQPSSPYYAVRVGYVIVGGSSSGIIFVSKTNVYTLGSNIISPVSLTAFSTTSNVLQLYGYSSGQIADLFDVYTYSGGSKVLYVDNAGVTHASNVAISAGTEANVTYSNVTINSGTVNVNAATANTFTATSNIAANVSTGAFSYGNLTYSDTGIIAAYANSVNSYVQIVMQNTNNGNAASSDFAVVNDTGSAYGDFGITSSKYSGTGRFYNANSVYLYGGSVDLVVGTLSANAVHFVANNSTTDAMTLNANNTVTINTLNQPTSANATFATASLPLVPAGYITVNLNGTNVKIPYYAV